jgi:hypothetical protein
VLCQQPTSRIHAEFLTRAESRLSLTIVSWVSSSTVWLVGEDSSGLPSSIHPSMRALGRVLLARKKGFLGKVLPAMPRRPSWRRHLIGGDGVPGGGAALRSSAEGADVGI